MDYGAEIQVPAQTHKQTVGLSCHICVPSYVHLCYLAWISVFWKKELNPTSKNSFILPEVKKSKQNRKSLKLAIHVS